MALGGDDAQATQGLDLFVHSQPLGSLGRDFVLARLLIQRFVGLNGLNVFFDIAAQHNVGTATRHVGGNGDHAWATCLGHDVGFASVLFGIEHLVRQLSLGQHFRNEF